MNKLILRVKLLGKNGLSLTLMYLTEMFMGESNNLLYYHTDEFTFLMHSGKSFAIAEDSLRFPHQESYISGQVATKYFDTDEKRFLYLKELYRCVTEWANKYHKFTDNNAIGKINMNDDFWII